MSHPAWVRGLKLYQTIRLYYASWVAPCVGAWIETEYSQLSSLQPVVAPCVGAWIETKNTIGEQMLLRSHPAWVRGLKP